MQTDEPVDKANDDHPTSLAILLDTDEATAARVLMVVDSTENLVEEPQEDGVLPALTLEGFGGEPGVFYSNLIAWLKAMMATVFDQMTTHELVAKALEFKAANLMTSSRDRRQQVGDNKPLELTTRIPNLCINYRPVKDVSQLLGTVRYMGNLVTEYYRYNGGLVQALPQVMAMARQWREPERLVQALQSHSPLNTLVRSPSFQSPGDSIGFSSHNFLGGYRLHVDTRWSSRNPVNELRGTTVRLKTSSPVPLPLPTKVVLPRFNLATSDRVLRTIIEQAQYLQSVNTLSMRQQRKTKLRELTGILENLRHVAETNAGDRSIEPLPKQVAGLLETYADWIGSPYIGLYSLACRNLRATLSVCEQNAM